MDAVERLRNFVRDHRYAIVVFDKHGCGNPEESRESVRDAVERSLSRNGWPDRCKAIVIEPELETWIWNRSKPSDPKEALKAVLRKTRKRLSARLYRSLAETVAVHRCLDPAFNELKATLQRWFPRSS